MTDGGPLRYDRTVTRGASALRRSPVMPTGTARMPDGEQTFAGPTNAAPYFTTWGPLDGPILRRHLPPALSVVPAPDCYWPIGIAFPVGQVAHRRGPAATFRLVVEKVEVEGRWVCVGRRFVRLGTRPRSCDASTRGARAAWTREAPGWRSDEREGVSPAP